MRDDFSKQTVIEIAKGVGFRCSNPECSRPTVGANAAQDGIVIIGVASHIYAASPGGPRYNAGQTREARRSKDNGIWLCQDCGKLVDADPENFTVEELINWKRAAQEKAFRELVAPRTQAATEESARISSIIAAEIGNGADADLQTLFIRVHAAAKADVATYLRTPIWSAAPVELTLKLYNDPDTPPFSISKLPLAVEVESEVGIVAPPGTGKTTTLLQFATGLLASSSIVPLYFRLGDWSAQSLTLLASLHQRSAFKNIDANELERLASVGRTLLLLDGWNELDLPARRKLRLEIEQVRRDFPFMRIVATTRQQALDIPISGPRISIELLSEEQQLTIARAHSADVGEKIVDQAWRTTGIRELIRIPLYLSALLSSNSQGTSPSTKEEVLRLFVEQHERVSDHAETLRATLFGCHTQILTTLASHMNASATPTITEIDARRIITFAIAQLREDGQISAHCEPSEILDVLTSHHTLMRSGTGNGTIAFQHQQLQEWFASHEVADLMRFSAVGDVRALTRLRGAVLDQPVWEESILFAVERVSRENGGATIIAHAIRVALPIDPMLAAEMIYRATFSVWHIVKSDILAFVDRWHRPGTVDRAVRFMIVTGRPEFESRIWPLASSMDLQIQLSLLRAAPRFRPSVLGPNLRLKVAALPEEPRQHLIAEIASESGIDGMDLAAELAKADPSPKVQAEVIQYFQFRRADRHVAIILADAHDDTWALLAKQGYAEEIRDPTAVERLRAERAKALDQATDPLQRLRLFLDQSSDYPDRDVNIASTIADARFPIRDQHGGTSLYFAQERAPAAILQGLKKRLEAGLELPYHTSELLAQLEVTDDGPIAAAILNVAHDDRNTNAVAIMAGPRIVAQLVDRYLALALALKSDRNNRTLYDEYQRLRSRIAATRAPSFVAAVITHARTDDPVLVSSLASLISLYGNDRKLPVAVDPAVKSELIAILREWVNVVISAPDGERYQLNDVSNAIGRCGFRELVPELKQLLDNDLTRLKKAREGLMDARRRGDIRATSDASTIYGNQYRDAFSRLGGDEVAAVAAEYLEDHVFAFDASMILKSISDKRLNLPEPDFRRPWPHFENVAAARADRLVSQRAAPANTLADPIFAAIYHLAKPENSNESQLLAIKLTWTALAMPHSNQDALIARVAALPQSISAKPQLFAAMALDGQTLDVRVIMQAIDEWLQDAGKDERHAWHKKQNTWEIEPWLELLPYTTQPESVIEGLTKVKAFYGKGRSQHWDRVLTAVAAVPGPEGEVLLASVARAHKDIVGDYEWMKAILGRDSANAVVLYVDLFIEGVVGRGQNAVDPWHVGRELAAFVQKFPQIKAELKTRYESVGVGPARAMLEHIFGEAGSEDELVEMAKKYSAIGQGYDGRIDAAVRTVALRRVPVQDGSNSFYIYPASVGRIRKYLFDMLGGKPQAASLAMSCLTVIDVLRDEHGIAPDDTRHPDISSERPWPTEAGIAQIA